MEKESRHEKFRRIGQKRIDEITHNFLLISNLGNKRYYSYDVDIVKQNVRYLYFIVEQVQKSFKIHKPIKLDGVKIDINKSSIKEDKFYSLFESRMNKLIKSLELFTNLSNRSNYTYKDEEIDRVINHFNKLVIKIEHDLVPDFEFIL